MPKFCNSREFEQQSALSFKKVWPLMKLLVNALAMELVNAPKTQRIGHTDYPDFTAINAKSK